MKSKTVNQNRTKQRKAKIEATDDFREDDDYPRDMDVLVPLADFDYILDDLNTEDDD